MGKERKEKEEKEGTEKDKGRFDFQGCCDAVMCVAKPEQLSHLFMDDEFCLLILIFTGEYPSTRCMSFEVYLCCRYELIS